MLNSRGSVDVQWKSVHQRDILRGKGEMSSSQKVCKELQYTESHVGQRGLLLVTGQTSGRISDFLCLIVNV
jgi:hypothetical protein